MQEIPGIFETSFAASVHAAEENQDFRSWKNQHAEAKPARIVHVNGAPGSGIVDQWSLVWASKDGNGYSTLITKSRSFLPSTPILSNETIDVQGSPAQDVEPPVEVPERVTMSELARLSQMLFGEQMEFLHCNLTLNECWVGSHEATKWPRAGATGGGFSKIGLEVLVDVGWIFLEDSFAGGPLDASFSG